MIAFLKKKIGLIAILAAIGVYIVVAGKTGFCPTCTAITDLAGITSAESDLTGKPMPEWSLTTLEGDLLHSSDLEGKVVILDFWATWCPPCRKEIPGFVEIQTEYAEQGVEVIGVSLDDTGSALVRSFSDENGINYTVAMGNREILEAAGGVKALPTTLIINREGDVVERHVGYTSKATFVRTIKSLL